MNSLHRRRLYTFYVDLRTARLCLDCEALHEEQQCPVCASETFAYITRWIPLPGKRPRPKAQPATEALEAYAEITGATPRRKGRLVTGGLMGITAIGLAGWLWNHYQPARSDADRNAGNQT